MAGFSIAVLICELAFLGIGARFAGHHVRVHFAALAHGRLEWLADR